MAYTGRPMPEVGVPMVEWAQWYARELGLRVFPCHGNKKPRIDAWPTEASSDSAQIAAWWTKYPSANIGALMGHGIWVLDVDDRHGAHLVLASLVEEHSALPDTWTAHTGRSKESRHYWFCGEERKRDIVKGLSIMGLGSYVVVPPSIHQEGMRGRYTWLDGMSPEDIMCAEAPAWLPALKSEPNTSEPGAGVTAPAPGSGVVITKGSRHNTLFAWTCHYRDRGFTENDTLDHVRAHNLEHCKPPKSDRHVVSVVRSTYATRAQFVPPPPLKTFITEPPPSEPLPEPDPTHPAWRVESPSHVRPVTLSVVDFSDMLEREYPIPKWVIPGLIQEGLNFLVGSPKSSKTYLASSLAIAVAQAMEEAAFWLEHYPVLHSGPVVYFSLEDDEGDSRRRVAELSPTLTSLPKDRLLFVYQTKDHRIPRFGEGLYETLRDAIIPTYHPAMIVLDPISYLYASARKSADPFTEVSDVLLPLRWLGKENHCAIVGVDHRRKKSVEDVDIFETTYGSNAKIAVSDALLMIVREQEDVTVHTRVRKAGDQTLTLTLTFTDGYAVWTFKNATDGLLNPANYGELRMRAIMALARSSTPMTFDELMLELNTLHKIPYTKDTYKAIKQALYRAKKDGEVDTLSRGKYIYIGTTRGQAEK